MALTNNLKPQLDLPVWEYCRFAPTNTTAISSLTTGNNLGNRYLYYQVSALLYRYDTWSDSWHQLASIPANVPTIMNASALSNYVGHYGQAISGDTNKIQLAGLAGDTLVGYKIKILSGTGAGQERTITSVSERILHDKGAVTTASSTAIVDATAGAGLKQWKTNAWKNYQVRIDYGTGRSQVRPILYNTNNNLVFTDTNHFTINPWSNCQLAAATAAGTIYVIESHWVTVDENWTTIPDSTSNFVILSGGVWNISQGVTTAPFFTFWYYDRLADFWYAKSTQTGLKAAVFAAGSDLKLERFTEYGGYILSGVTSSSTSNSVTISESLVPMDYANFEIRIEDGNAIGENHTILSNTTNKINITDTWGVIPNSGSTYKVYRDVGKLFLVGGNDAAMYQYSMESDQWTTGKQFEHGQCNQLAAIKKGQRPFALSSITRTATSMITSGTSISAAGTGYNINDILTVDAKGGTLRVTAINESTGGVTGVELETCGTGYSIGAKTTTVNPAGGTGCQITLSASDIDFTELAVTPIAHNFKIGDQITITGATGASSAKFNGTYNIVGNSTNCLSFSYCSVGDPGAATATIENSPSVTQLVDCTKNWAINEHAGRLVQLSTAAQYSVGQVRRIVSNTKTTLVWTLAATAPVNGTTKYVIEDIKPFGTELTLGSEIGLGNEGFASAGTTTSLVDTTKNWETNYWSKVANRKVRITEGTGKGNEISITSNTSNQLNFAAQSFTPDETTRYIIMDAFGTATAGSTTTLTDSTKNWEVNCWINKRVKFLSGTGQGLEYIITSNTATVLTFATGTAPDVSTAYAILESTPKANGVSLDCVVGSSNSGLNSRYLYSFVGTGTAELMRYNINTEHWRFMPYFPQTETMTTGSMYCYDGADRIYFWSGTAGRLMYYDLVKNVVVPASTPPYGMSTAISGNRMEIVETADGLKYLYLMRHTGNEMWRTLLYL